MGKYKENARYNVVSMRVSNEEKLALEKMMQQSSKSVSRLMRDAIQLYTPQLLSKIEYDNPA